MVDSVHVYAAVSLAKENHFSNNCSTIFDIP